MIKIVSLANCAEFDAYICAAPAGHFMQRSAWGRCRPGWQWQGLMCVDSRGTVRAAMALLSRRVSGTKLRLFYAPRGPIFERNNHAALAELLTEAQKFVRDNGGYLLRMDPQIPEGETKLLRFLESFGFRVNVIDDFSAFQPRFVYQIDLLREEAELWQNLHHKTRYNVGAAHRNGLQVVDVGVDGCDAFAQLLAETGARRGFRGHSAGEIMDLLVQYGEDAHLWLAVSGETAVAGILCLTQGGQMWNLYSASSELGRQKKANDLLQWYAICQAKGWGCRCYDLRGVEGPAAQENPCYGLHRFKRHLGAELVCYAGQMDWVCRPAVHGLIALGQRWLLKHRGSGPFAKNAPMNGSEERSRSTGSATE